MTWCTTFLRFLLPGSNESPRFGARLPICGANIVDTLQSQDRENPANPPLCQTHLQIGTFFVLLLARKGQPSPDTRQVNQHIPYRRLAVRSKKL